ncbi:MAG: class II aldolase/adducin family protein [Chloroflexota bacterium]|nr:class II aldolase/adducin family protein [Chloroflexota bacterium]MDE2909060.1 class II aldolase/adducin family protein [Chloroflexota bacterium]
MTRNLSDLVNMTRALGEPAMDCVIIGEGNTSMRIDDASFYVKASGHQMRGIDEDGFVAVRFEPMLDMLDDPPQTLAEQKAITQAAKLDQASARSPSIEVSFHAMLLRECGVQFIGHTHPTAINQIMCSQFATDFASQRRFPDEAVLCGPVSALVPYADPGLPLALKMRERVRQYMAQYDEAPKLILLENHGMIALGDSPAEILNITAMAVKAARIFLGALLTGKPTRMPDEEAWHVVRRPDEIYRRNLFVDDDAR